MQVNSILEKVAAQAGLTAVEIAPVGDNRNAIALFLKAKGNWDEPLKKYEVVV